MTVESMRRGAREANEESAAIRRAKQIGDVAGKQAALFNELSKQIEKLEGRVKECELVLYRNGLY